MMKSAMLTPSTAGPRLYLELCETLLQFVDGKFAPQSWRSSNVEVGEEGVTVVGLLAGLEEVGASPDGVNETGDGLELLLGMA